jgi:predicted polyphosphate/ATP-dependent NAD kinase
VTSATSDELPVVAGSAIGIIVNPMSGRDIRRLVAQASVFPNGEKTSMVLRIIRTLGTLGVETVLLSTDTFGIAAGVRREIDRLPDVRWPKVEFQTLERRTGTHLDTREFARVMAGRCGAVTLLGGDGTMRAAVPALGDTPMLGLSTGTNNAFPVMMEATVVGMALAMIATGTATQPVRRAKLLHVDVTRATGDVHHEVALVDACLTTVGEIGSRALWQPESLRELYCTFAEPHSIGLSSIAGRILPTARTEPRGVAIRCTDPSTADRVVLAPLAPGLLTRVGVGSVEPMAFGVAHAAELSSGTVALDGEREVVVLPQDSITVTLKQDGPLVIDVPAVLA